MKKLPLSLLIILFTLTSSNVWSNPGFRDLKPGRDMTPDIVGKICPLLTRGGKPFHPRYVSCYGINNIKFKVSGRMFVRTLFLDMGPIVASDGSFFATLNNLAVSSEDEPNIYLKMKKNFDDKYILDYEYSERDRQLFNEGEKDDLLHVYSNGQVALRINYNKNDNSYSNRLWLYIEYRDKDLAKSFLEENRPITATLDDF